MVIGMIGPCQRECHTGNLADVRVHNSVSWAGCTYWRMRLDESAKSVYIYAVGGHESFYRDLKEYLKS